MNKILVFTATYNESENITNLINDILKYTPTVDILVVDDNSPDGTGKIVDELKQKINSLEVIHRTGKLGLGTAHKLALKYAKEKGYEALITMDADFSHHPKYLPSIIEKLKDYDFVIGSRYVDGGRSDYTGKRKLLSLCANFLVKTLLGIKLNETTTAYRGYSKNLLNKLNYDQIISEGYSFFFEFIWRVSQTTNKMAEIPIHFEDRKAGASKINKKEIYMGVLNLYKLFFKRIFNL